MSDAILITSPSNPTVVEVRKLHRMSECDRRKEFLVEGTHQVAEALAAQWPLKSVFWTAAWEERNRQLVDSWKPGMSKYSVLRYSVSDAVLRRLATTETPDGVVAVATWPSRPLPDRVGLGILMVSIRDPGNMGTLIRSAVAAGADATFVTPDSVSPVHPKVIRSSAGQWFRSPPHVLHPSSLFSRCRAQEVQILGAGMKGKCLWEVNLVRPTLMVLGNEGSGLEREILDSMDDQISVPMCQGVESLNVAMTGTLLMYEAMRQRRTQAT
jgi:TrmH family RNA methyltransferase